MSFDSDLNRSVGELILLKLFSVQPMYGYQIINVVNERSINALQWKQGTVYPCLHRMEKAGLIRSRSQTTETGRDGRFYSITPKGRRLLSVRLVQWRHFSSGVRKLLG